MHFFSTTFLLKLIFITVQECGVVCWEDGEKGVENNCTVTHILFNFTWKGDLHSSVQHTAQLNTILEFPRANLYFVVTPFSVQK